MTGEDPGLNLGCAILAAQVQLFRTLALRYRRPSGLDARRILSELISQVQMSLAAFDHSLVTGDFHRCAPPSRSGPKSASPAVETLESSGKDRGRLHPPILCNVVGVARRHEYKPTCIPRRLAYAVSAESRNIRRSSLTPGQGRRVNGNPGAQKHTPVFLPHMSPSGIAEINSISPTLSDPMSYGCVSPAIYSLE